MSESCLFCEIAARRIAASVVYEDDAVMAFLDINPLALGHMLLITKMHYETLLEVPKQAFSALFSAAQNIAAVQMKTLGAEGINWLQSSGTAAGQEIFHFHIHLIPRFVDDDHHWNWHPVSYGDDLPIAEMATSIRKSIVDE